MAYFSGIEPDDVITVSNELLNAKEGGRTVETLAGNDYLTVETKQP
ncbi:hypothetical protein M1D97_00325 [Kushneria sp. AK178]